MPHKTSIFRRFREWWSFQLARYPRRLMLLIIIFLNVVFILGSALFISHLHLPTTEGMGFLAAAFYTVTMIMDAGCIQFVIENVGEANVIAAVGCLIIIFVGMILFTGAAIGYLTNFLSDVFEKSQEGERKLHLSGHMVILNWNNRASEIVNDLLFSREKGRRKVVVLVGADKEAVEDEIAERLAATISQENRKLWDRCRGLPPLRRLRALRRGRLRSCVSVVVRQGDVFSSKQLEDISVKYARTIIILGNDPGSALCRLELQEKLERGQRGNAQIIKTLMQVADITAAESSADDQRIVVEITDRWTGDLVDRIIAKKQREKKCRIVPLPVNELLGQLLSQFSLMPELNQVYTELFSNKGATFYSQECGEQDRSEDIEYIPRYLKRHFHALPLASMPIETREAGRKTYRFYTADVQDDIDREAHAAESGYQVRLRPRYRLPHKTVIMLGHNSNCRDIMNGFRSFQAEWGPLLDVIVIDNKEGLEKFDYYQDYRSFVKSPVAEDIYDQEKLCYSLRTALGATKGDVSILILSDDRAAPGDVDANTLASLIYVQDVLYPDEAELQRWTDSGEEDYRKDITNIDVIVEIIDPKHSDVVEKYSVDNVVISNRYISKMVTQIGEKEALYEFYRDILTYDDEEAAGTGYVSKEIYAKQVSEYFAETPGPCTAAELVRAVYAASSAQDRPREEICPAVVLGYARRIPRQGEGESGTHTEVTLFSGDQTAAPVELREDDKLIVFTNH